MESHPLVPTRHRYPGRIWWIIEGRVADPAKDVVVDASVGFKWYVPEVYSDDAARLVADSSRRI